MTTPRSRATKVVAQPVPDRSGARPRRKPADAGARVEATRAAAAVAAETGVAAVPVARGRLAHVSVRGTMGAGAWVGFALGLSTGAVIGATLAWLAGALVSWQRDLAFTLGVASRLLPLGDQTDLLREINARWYVSVPVTAVSIGLFGALVGALVAGILAAAYNRSPRHAVVEVELPQDVKRGDTG